MCRFNPTIATSLVETKAKFKFPQMNQIKKVNTKELHDPGQEEITLKAVIDNVAVDIHPSNKFISPQRVVMSIGRLETFLSKEAMNTKLSININQLCSEIL